MIEIKRPSTFHNPDFITGKMKNTDYKFICDICCASISIDFERQINNSWAGRTEQVTEDEGNELRAFYGIGLSGKSHDGGLPIFDKVTCLKCGANYITYCGVIEFSNSVYAVTVNGIMRK